ncbi:SET methyltransferase domain containing protein [Nitzschia inconspicua]|uniref:SET methyltransferase domain containing protein n=1 Tax=Nitzschia inconspicua TaxID=303405 RepID=A0A9K3PNF7_9STRA|nr:SET methyltransferase domain containing protein [Nitzschia inconspicua]
MERRRGDDNKTSAYTRIIELLTIFLFGQSGIFGTFLVGKKWSPYFKQQLGWKNEPMNRTLSSLTDAYNTQESFQFVREINIPPLHRRIPMNPSWVGHNQTAINERYETCTSEETTCDIAGASSSSQNPTSPFPPRKLFHEMLVHPLLLNLDPEPESVALVMWNYHNQGTYGNTTLRMEMSSLMNEISQHKSVTKVYIIVEDSHSTRSCHAAIALNRLRHNVSFHCIHVVDFERQTIIVDTVILPNWPQNKDEEGTEIDFWHSRLSPRGALVAILGATYPLQYIMEQREIVNKRWHRIEQLNNTFARIIDYDIPAFYYHTSNRQQHLSSSQSKFTQAPSRFPINIAVAFKSLDGVAHWRKNEAHYNLAVRSKLTLHRVDDLGAFDAAIMLTIQNPPSHSSWFFCEGYGSDSDCEFHGYDPEYPNIPLTDLYVGKSKAGEHAGRGVFANVDIPSSSNIGLETTTQSIHFEWMTTELHRNMMEETPEYAGGKAKIVHVYAEAYGYASSPFGKQQETVMSHFLTFVNHGCNGTSNIGERDADPSLHTEWSVDLQYGIPEDLKTKLTVPYSPSADRDVVQYSTNCVAGRDIQKGEELYDNYMNFGGDEYFEEMVLSLRDECSGSLGLVEQYQSQLNTGEMNRKIKCDPVDINADP